MPLSTRQLPFLVVLLIPLLASPVQAIDLNGYRKASGLKPMRAHATLGADINRRPDALFEEVSDAGSKAQGRKVRVTTPPYRPSYP